VVADTGQIKGSLAENLILSTLFGFFYGVAAGFVGWFFERRFFYNKALWVVFLGKIVISLIVFIILINIVRLVLHPYVSKLLFNTAVFITEKKSWDAFFYLMLIYNIAIELLITFINQVNKKYGPGVLLLLLMGKYRSPKEEERIFLFMDLKSSTLLAETLGHLKYSAFIRDSFMDINTMLSKYNAQIYQYVGDEIVITWPITIGLRNAACIEFFFACQAKFIERADYYNGRYGEIPQFKAGLHMGKVTAVEVGDIKRDIAYHGDTLNTAARIQSICNNYDKKFLSSVYVLNNVKVNNLFKIESIGAVILKGKTEAVEIASIEMA
jgi:adenylate cyclase